ncbi:MAG: hypothetical protein PHW32_03555 [Bacilli bacterium]|nr:hypothetical protein [Bacilli bacterium]MDD4282769.1 hypothetical protein [Bacilli bacterium]MDD4718373.1 hypothetical protein [Bacilli bacterium]
MHNEYITINCIIDKRDKLTLLKYTHIDITKISKVLKPIVIDLMEQYYKHVKDFHNINKDYKKYKKIKLSVEEQLKDMEFIKEKFIEYFSKPGFKTKEDLFTYLFAFQISEIYFNEYIYNVLIEALKEDFDKDFWNKYKINEHELGGLSFPDVFILKNPKDNMSIGQADHNFKNSVIIINDSLDNRLNNNDRITNKLNLIKDFNVVLKNYYCEDFAIFNMPYQDSINDLVDNIKVSRDFEKSKQLIKRK